MKLNSKILGIIILVFVFGGISLSAAFGYWNTEKSGEGSPASGQGQGQGVSASENTEGLIRGRTTFQELLDLGLTQSIIEEVIGGQMPEPQMRVKDYCSAKGLSFETIKSAFQEELDG